MKIPLRSFEWWRLEREKKKKPKQQLLDWLTTGYVFMSAARSTDRRFFPQSADNRIASMKHYAVLNTILDRIRSFNSMISTLATWIWPMCGRKWHTYRIRSFPIAHKFEIARISTENQSIYIFLFVSNNEHLIREFILHISERTSCASIAHSKRFTWSPTVTNNV